MMDSSKPLVEDELLICRELKSNITKRTPMITAAKDIAHGLHEHKFNLILNVIEVLGIPIALDLYHQTARIQKDGGTPTVDGERKKTPGGVFLTLVKKTASADQKSRIFYAEKKFKKNNHKQRRKRKTIDDKVTSEKMKNIQSSDKNIPATTTTATTSSSNHDSVYSTDTFQNRPVEPLSPFLQRSSDPCPLLVEGMELSCDTPLLPSTAQNSTTDTDIELARQFEEMDESHVDFGIELS